MADHSLLDDDRLNLIAKLLEETADVPGVLVELGTYEGGTARWISQHSPVPRTLHVFDTFTGLPEPTGHDGKYLRQGLFESKESVARRVLADVPDVVFHVGEFPDGSEADLSVAFAHVDMDLYEPTLRALQWFHTALAPGGIAVFDDVPNNDAPGIRQALLDGGWQYETYRWQAIIKQPK